MATAGSPAITSTSSPFARRTRRQIGLRLLPLLFLLYIVNYLDRTSLAYAAIGMSRDLGFSDSVFGLGVGVFFVSYVSLQIPGAMLVERWSARRMISVTLIAWGSLTALTALVHTPGQLYLARFVLGAAEAGFFPGVVVYLSHWYLREDRAKATSNFMAAIPLSFVIGSPVAGFLLGFHWFGMAGWRALFVLEGLPAIVLGVVAFFYLTDWPREAKWLTPEQQHWVGQTLREEEPADAETTTIWQALRSRAVLMLAGVVFFAYFTFYSFVFYFPSMLKQLSGFSDMQVGGLGALPYVALFVAMQVNGWHSDRSGERRWHSVIPLLIAVAGVLGLLLQPHSVALSLGLFSMVAVGSCYLPVFWTIPSEILSPSSAAVAVGLINAVGSISGFAGPYLFGYLRTRTGSYSTGLAMLAISALAGSVLMWCTPRRVQ